MSAFLAANNTRAGVVVGISTAVLVVVYLAGMKKRNRGTGSLKGIFEYVVPTEEA